MGPIALRHRTYTESAVNSVIAHVIGKAEAGKGEAGKAPNAAGAAGDAKGKPPATKPRKDTLLFALW